MQVGSITNFQQRGSLGSLFFSFCFVAYGCGWVSLPSSSIGGSLLPLFLIFFWLVLGCHHQVLIEGEISSPFSRSFLLFLRHHHQFLVEGEFAPSFLLFFFVASKTPSPRFNREGACSPFFIFLLLPQKPCPSLDKREAWAPPLLFFFFDFFFF